MNLTKADLRFRRRLLLLVLLSSGLAVIGAAILDEALASNEVAETALFPVGKEVAVTGEIVMIEGNVEIVEDPSGGKKDVYLIMDHLHVAEVAGDEAIQFHVNEKTRMDDDLKVGDRVEVLAAQNGEAFSITKTK